MSLKPVVEQLSELLTILEGEEDGSKGLTEERIRAILAEEGLSALGQRYGKAGEMFGLSGMARQVALGKRDIMVNVYQISMWRSDHVTKPQTTWVNYVSELRSKMTEEKLRTWAKFVKGGYTTKELLTIAREQFEKKHTAGGDATVVVTGKTKKG